MVKTGQATRLFIFTWNNYTDESIKLLEKVPCKYMIYGKEVAPTTGTPHLQGAIYFTHTRDIGPLRKLLTGADVRHAKGSVQDNIDYCSKEWDYTELGDRPSQGKRTDLIAVADELKKKSIDETALAYPVEYIKYHRGMEKLKNIYQGQLARRFRVLNVICLIGQAGSGKTSRVYKDHGYDDVFKLPKSNTGCWFGSYSGQSILLIDDFYGSSIKYDHFLEILDGHPLEVEVKGGFTWALYEVVYITSNVHPEYWYTNKGMTPALSRRINKIEMVE